MTTTETSLQVHQFISSERNKVFKAWIDAEMVKKWLCPEECHVLSNEAEVNVGGSYRESMQCGDDIHTVFGTYREIVPDQKLVFTHLWDEPEASETVVIVDFTDTKGGILVTITQQGFKNAATAKGHEQGWASALRNLARLFPELRDKA